MSFSKEYDGDGKLFLVKFPVRNIVVDEDELVVSYNDQNGSKARKFGSETAMMYFLNWLADYNL